ncbi:hypothetical protein DRN67_02705 [Candidatus Micrarchaeota archaeon]|nr:MAG: hypothetical protein DRN67_02705 [Candidatus Micrarchaeota archaeon]
MFIKLTAYEGAFGWYEMRTLAEAIVELSDAMEEKDVHALRKLSNQCLDKVSLEEKHAFLKPAMIAYALAKVIAKPHYWKGRSQTVFFNEALKKFERAAAVAESDEGTALDLLEDVEKMLRALDVKDKRFVRDIMEKAKLKTASTLYAQGFSLDRAIEMTGADKRELIKYIGKTMMFDRTGSARSMEQRLKALREIIS